MTEERVGIQGLIIVAITIIVIYSILGGIVYAAIKAIGWIIS